MLDKFSPNTNKPVLRSWRMMWYGESKAKIRVLTAYHVGAAYKDFKAGKGVLESIYYKTK